MTHNERKMMKPTEDFISNLLAQRNAGTEECTTSSDLAKLFGLSAPDLLHFLIDIGVLYRERVTYELRLRMEYDKRGLAKMRSLFRYTHNGKLKETRYPVWTEKGKDFIINLLKQN